MVHSSTRDSTPQQTDETTPKPGMIRWSYRFVAGFSALFIFTVFVMVAVTMSDPRVETNESMKLFFDRHGLRLIATEVTAILSFVLIAFALDRRESWKKYHREYAEWEARMQKISDENANQLREKPPESEESHE